MSRFIKDEFIKHEDKTYRCVVCDEELAVFARADWKEKVLSTTFDDIFVVSNQPIDDGFKYELL